MTATRTVATTAATTPAATGTTTATASPAGTPDGGFPTVFGRELIGELPNFVHRPYLVVTMADLWPRFEHLFDSHLGERPHAIDGIVDDAVAVGLL